MERRLAAILAADLVGYSRLMQADESGTLRRLTALREQILEPLIARHRGRVVKLIGDGLLVEFASLVEATECALAWQAAVAEQESEGEASARLSFRIGVNLGDIIVADDDIYGDGVNVATRLEQLAEPNGICLSGDAYRQVRGKIEAAFEDLGEQEVKNITEPIRVYRVSSARSVDAGAAPRSRPPLGERPSIAVLPLSNMSGDPEQEYFADGITEDIITYLSRFRGLLVIGEKSSFHYKGKTAEPRTIAKDLGAQYLVQGSLRRAGGRIRLTVQLVEAETGVRLWAERYDREVGDLFVLQDEIVESIVQTLVGRLTSAGAKHASRKAPQNLAAYDYVLQARAIISDSRENLQRCRALYEKAIELDPECGHAYAGLAATYSFEWTSGWSESMEETLDKAVSLAQKAAALDDLDSVAQRRLAVFQLFKGEREQAEVHLDRALSLNPNDADAMAYRALFLIYAGDPDGALAELSRATRRNPFHPTWYYWLFGLAHYAARRYQEAVAPLLRAIDSFPNFVAPHRHLAACYAQLGQRAKAERERAKILELEPSFTIAKIARTFAYRDPADLEHYCEGLRKAGLPD